ncbi:pentapeptide repeat-containing protein [Pseudoalteromonas piscicida]
MGKEQHNNSAEVTLEGDAALNLWLQGKDAWNEWIEKHPNASVSFEGVNFSYNTIDSKLAADSTNKRLVFKNKPLSLIDFSGFKFVNVVFKGAIFDGPVNFSLATFIGNATFSEAIFKNNAMFCDSSFKKDVLFSKANFHGNATFSKSNFLCGVNFQYVTCSKKFEFREVQSFEKTSFVQAAFKSDTNFTKTKFHKSTFFTNAQFAGDANFNQTEFKSHISFMKAKFQAQSDFILTIFECETYFPNVEFIGNSMFFDCGFFGSHADFKQCKFLSNLVFEPGEARNLNELSFEGTYFDKQFTLSGHFNCIPDLRQTKTSHHIDLSLLTIKLNRHFLKNTGMEATVGQADADRLCRLKEIAESNKNHERALAFHADELRAKRWHIFNPWQSILDGLYSLTSNYGQSIMRPCMYLLASVFIFASATLSQTKQSSYDITQMKTALTISVATATPFLAISKEARTKSTEELFNEELPDNYYLYSYIHSGSSFVFMFLIGLGLRNRFRI